MADAPNGVFQDLVDRMRDKGFSSLSNEEKEMLAYASLAFILDMNRHIVRLTDVVEEVHQTQEEMKANQASKDKRFVAMAAAAAGVATAVIQIIASIIA